jgi:hypothetical protein
MLEFAIVAIILFLFVIIHNHSIRISDAIKITAQLLNNPTNEQLVPTETKTITDAEYDLKKQPRPHRLKLYVNLISAHPSS